MGRNPGVRLAFAALLATLGLSTLPASAAALDVRISEVHVTQGQSARSLLATERSILVAHRSTAVRAVIESTGGAPQNVSGVLRVFVDGVEITPAAGLPPINQLAAAPPGTDVLETDDATLNFELPLNVRLALEPRGAAGTVGFLRSQNVDFQVDLTQSNDDNPGNDANDHHRGSLDWTVQRQPESTVFYMRLRLTERPTVGFSDANFIRRGVGSAMLFGALPFDDSCPACLYRQGVGDFTLDGPNSISLTDPPGDTPSSAVLLLDKLEELRQGIVVDGMAPGNAVRLYAWLPALAMGDHNGASRAPFVAYGFDSRAGGQGTIAHEIAHTFGLAPTASPGFDELGHWSSEKLLFPDVGWDVGGRLIGNPTDNNVAKRAKDSDFFELLNAGARPVNERWTGMPVWTGIANHAHLAPVGNEIPARPCQTLQLNGALAGRLSQRFTLNAPSLRIWRMPFCFRGAEFEPLRASASSGARIAATSGADASGPLLAQVRLRDSRGRTRTVSVPFDATDVFDDVRGRGAPAAGVPGGFSLSVPARAGENVASVRIAQRAGNRTLGTLRRTGARPVVRITSPSRGATITRGFALRWAARDADTRDSALRFRVAYSPDGGSDWVPVDVNLRGRSLQVPLAALPATDRGRGILRVYANDGANTTYADLRGLSLRARTWAREQPKPVG